MRLSYRSANKLFKHKVGEHLLGEHKGALHADEIQIDVTKHLVTVQILEKGKVVGRKEVVHEKFFSELNKGVSNKIVLDFFNVSGELRYSVLIGKNRLGKYFVQFSKLTRYSDCQYMNTISFGIPELE